ncbi:AP2-like ethylene-responsive transcription factor At1g16060 [Rhodamnia argentea]|uniref:AP2-like ethylene-responsive transcription factor At1g16060 n=1 Tax=Rhodamnia argentea TaxID=178133 RepID=A0A8B8PLF8_9MYRT|nr:AP2-like ethylene-responsive transcription factor At1g16060 [Rhodamnia argentea]
MAKLSQQNQRNNANDKRHENVTSNNAGVTKVKRTRRSVPRGSPPQRSSIYRGVTRHRWTGRYEAHLWDKNCWNESQNKKGRQVYLGAYHDEEAAAHAYDLAALKYWGEGTILNFPPSTYEEELKEMEGQSREEYIGSLRRKSNGFSRGVSKYRGVARHHHNGRWEARIGRVFGNKYLYLGTYATQEEAAIAYDMAAIEYRGLNAVTNFDLSRYIKWLKPVTSDENNSNLSQTSLNPDLNPSPNFSLANSSLPASSHQLGISYFQNQQTNVPIESLETLPAQPCRASATSALGLLLQSSKFKEMMEMTSAVDCSQSPWESELPQCSSFPDEVKTYFECRDLSCGTEGDDTIFADLNLVSHPMFELELEA